MNDRDALLAAITREPADDLAWLALADWLEECDHEPRAGLVRVTRRLLALGRDDPHRPPIQSHLCELLAAGVEPCGPELVNRFGMRFVLVPAGRFWRKTSEVDMARPFWLGKYPVTQAEYARVLGEDPSAHKGPGRPVEQVSRYDVGRFLFALGDGGASRLPTYEEWEHACHAGTTTAYHVGEKLTSHLARFRDWYSGAPVHDETAPAGSFRPNAFGLHDMHGNVRELCRMRAEYVCKGGSFRTSSLECGTSHVQADYFENTDDLGFRVLREWTP